MYEGVCSCSSFWERTLSQDRYQADTDSTIMFKDDSIPPRTSSITSPGSPREICFFWYHDTCRRGTQCKLAHEFHITWPITPPPGFVHYEPCKLPLCPLRQDIVALNHTKNERQLGSQLGGQLHGAALSYLSRATPIEVRSNNDKSVDTDYDAHNEGAAKTQKMPISMFDPNSRALTDSCSDSYDLESDNGGEEATMKVTVDSQHNKESLNVDIITCPPPSFDNMEHFDVSDFGRSPPSSDTGDAPILSLSHEGTLDKRKRTTSPDEINNNNKRTKQKPTSDLGGCISILECHANHRDVKGSSNPDYPPVPVAFLADPSHDLPLKSSVTTRVLSTQDRHSTSFNSRSRILNGSTSICFYWYHKGECRPKRRYGRSTNCMYAHTMDIPILRVSLPPGITNHNPDCSLPHCPIRLAQNSQNADKMSITEDTDRPIKDEPSTPVRRGPLTLDTGYSSSPRDSIIEARYFLKKPKFGGNRKLPKLTGASRQRFKFQKNSIEKWQAENNIKPFDANRKLEEKIELKRMKKELKMQKRREKRLAGDSILKYEDGPTVALNPATTAILAKQHSKKNRDVGHRHRTRNLYDVDVANGGNVERFDPEAELYKKSFQPIAGFPESIVIQNVREEMEYRQNQIGNTVNMIELPKFNPQSNRQCLLGVGRSASDDVDQLNRKDDAEGGSEEGKGRSNKSGAIVDYELPMGEARLDWDTDFVRRLFGEIE
jgi:hypothetical protein